MSDGASRDRIASSVGSSSPRNSCIGARSVDVEIMMGVFHRRHRPAPPDEFGDQLLGQCGLAGIFPAGDAEDVHGAMLCNRRSATARSSGVLMLKNGSIGSRPVSSIGKSTST